MRIDSSICAVVPVYNSASTLTILTAKLQDALSRFRSYRIVFVDDDSSDNSAAVIKELCAAHQHIIGIMLDQNYGQQSAVFCGLSYADTDYTVIIDDDLEQDPADIITLYDAMQKGYDAVYGINAHSAQKGIFRGIGSRLRDRLFQRITNIPQGVKVCSFRILNRKTSDNILKADTRFVYISLELLKYTSNIGNVAVRYNTPVQSHYNALKLMRLLVKMYVYYAPATVFKRFRKKGPCYNIKEIVR